MSDLEKQIIDAYVFLRKNNQSIPDSTLDYMKYAALNYSKLQAENAELKKQSQWVSVDDKPTTPYEHTEWDNNGDNCTFDGCISNTFELSDGSPYNFARGHYQDDGNWVVYGAEHDFQIIDPSEVKFYKPLPTPPEGE